MLLSTSSMLPGMTVAAGEEADKKGAGLSVSASKRVLTPFVKQREMTAAVAGPLTRTMPRAAPPVAVAIAAMVSLGS
jgi:hypothetical protein